MLSEVMEDKLEAAASMDTAGLQKHRSPNVIIEHTTRFNVFLFIPIPLRFLRNAFLSWNIPLAIA